MIAPRMVIVKMIALSKSAYYFSHTTFSYYSFNSLVILVLYHLILFFLKPLIHNQMYATGHVELVLIIKSLVLQIGIAALSLTKDVHFQQTTAAAVIKASDTNV